MRVSILVLAAAAIVYGLINLAKIHWGLDVVWWLLVAWGVIRAVEEVVGHPWVVKRVSRYRSQPESA